MQIPPGSAIASSRAAILTPSPTVILVYDDVTDVYSNAKVDPLLRRHVRVFGCHTTLELGRTFSGVHGAGELDQYAIARGLHDASSMVSNGWVDERFSE